MASGSRVVVAAFFAVLWLSFAGTWLGWGQFTSADEYRRFSVLPTRLDATFPGGLSLYLHDHFGFRGWLVTLNAYLRAKMLHTSTSPRVVIGKQGFLFFADEGALQNYVGSSPMTDCELESWVHLFERRAAWLSLHKIPLVIMIAPDKHTIYPEMMPDGVPHSTAPSSAERLMNALSRRTNATVVDLRPALREAKRDRPAYYLTDSHWSQWGAFTAYREVLRGISKNAPELGTRIGEPLQSSALHPGVILQPGDLNRILGLGFVAPEYKATVAPPDAPLQFSKANDAYYLAGTGDTRRPRLAMMVDSFGSFLMPFLHGHFSRVYALRTWSFDPQIVLNEHPDAMVIEIVERRLNDPPPFDPESEMKVPTDIPSDPAVWGMVDEPIAGTKISGAGIQFSGWALTLQPNAVQKVQIMLDGKAIGEPALHIPRPDVGKIFVGLRDSANAGWKGSFDSRDFANGRHQFALKVLDSSGHAAEIGARQFCIAN